MDETNFEQIAVSKKKIGEKTKLLKENLEVTINFFEDNPLSVELPISIECKVISTDVALKAKRRGANYIAFGSFFKSKTKKTAFKANLAILRWAKKKINMPTVAIGGINSSNYKKILSNGADFIACSSYIWNNKKLDPVSAIDKFK